MASTSITRTSWTRLLALFTFASFIETVFYGQLGAFTPLYLPALGVAPDQVVFLTGITGSLGAMVGLPFLPLWGALADRYARKPVIIRSYLIEMAVGLICLLAGNIWVFLVGRTLAGLALGNSGLMLTTLAEHTPSNRNGLAFSIMNSAAPVGVFIGPLIGGPVVDHWGFPALLGIDAALLLLVVLAMTFGYQDSYRGNRQAPLFGMAVESVRIVLRSRRLRALFPALFLLFAGWVMVMTYMPVMIAHLYQGTDPGTMVGIVMGVGGLVSILLGPLTGVIADRLGHERVLVAGAILAAVLWPIPGLSTSLGFFAASWGLVNGLTSGVFSVSFNVLSNSARPEERGRVMSFAYLPVNVGGILGPALGSLVTQASVFAVFPAAALLTAAGVGAMILARKESRT